MMSSLNGKRALITGGSSGIGRATATALAREGLAVALNSRRREPLEEVASTLRESHDTETHVITGDVRNESDVDRVVDSTISEFGGLDVVVNNAGVIRGIDNDLTDLDTEEYRTMLETNVDGTFFTTRAALPHLVESKGNLIFVGSFAGRYPRSFSPVYAATKWWVRGFAHSVEASYGPEGVAVSVINPGAVRTEFGAEEGTPWRERFDADESSRPEEIGEAVAFAARQEHSTISELNIHNRNKLGNF